MVWIKSITIQGFKSFGNKRTTIKMPLGLVVITGPNGGGKSTVLDAVKFALGELSAHNLRVDRFSKLLHESSKGIDNSAYVTISLDNSDHSLPVDSEEVVITRKLYATGESEYILNGRTVSRNEILTILAAANIKPDGLNLVTQGSVVGIAEMTSKEIRQVLEDAAGISGYRKRRDEAYKELEVAQKNIDIAKAATSEVRARVKQLEIERNQLLRKNLLEKAINSLKSVSLINEAKSLRESLTALENRDIEIVASMSSKQKEADEIRQTLAAAKNEVEQLTTRMDEIINQLRETDRQIYSLDSQKTRKHVEKNSAQNALQRSTLQQKILRERIEKWRERTAQLQQLFEKKKAEAEKTLSEYTALEQYISTLRNEVEEQRSAVNEVENRYTAILEELRFLKISDDGKSLLIENLEKQISRKQAEKAEAEKQVIENQNRINSVQSKLNQVTKDIELSSSQIAEASAHLEELEKNILDETEKISRIEKTLEEARMLKTSIQQMVDTLRTEENGEVSNGGVKTVRSVLGNKMTDWHKAVVGDWLNAVVVDDFQTAHMLASTAAENRIPLKIVFEPLDVDELVGALAHGSNPRALDSVKKLTVMDRNVATADGVYVGPRGLISVFAEKNREQIVEHLVQNIQKIQTIEEKLSKAREAKNLKLADLRKQSSDIRSQLSGLREKVQAKSLEKAKLETEFETLMKTHETLNQRIRTAEDERSRLEAEKRKLLQLVQEKTDDLSKIQALKTELETQRAALKRLEELLRQKSLQSSNLYRAHVNVEREIDALNIELGKLAELISQAEKELESNLALDEKLSQDLEKITVEIENIDNQLSEINRRKNELEETRKQLSSQINEKNMLVRQLEQKLSSILVELDELEKQHNVLAVERVRIEAMLKTLNDRLQSFTDPNQEESVLPTSLFQLLENEYAEIPVVNQLAAMQYDSIIENYRLRSSRINELELERKRILDLIESINREEAEAFSKALKSVSDSFGFYFNQLTGGEGFLRLENPEDPLASGVEMVVKFIGKQARSTVSISGGEKSVSAVALILALQDLTPAQFYIFDEIDAHLDNVYVKNLVNLLKKMSSKKQIIIITLKDIIAEHADALFGVYMVNESSHVVRTKLAEVVDVGK
ncbi:MAG: chromosome segregation SMC family protein [Candidatus Caldarchaeum sp.]